jgi:LCP family protein required for cell wall assembly
VKFNLKRETFWAAVWVGAWFVSLAFWVFSPMARSMALGEPVTTLVFGTDAARDSEHSDTLLLSSFDPRRHSLDFLSVPRDTRVNMPGYRFHRINEIYGYELRKTNDVGRASRALLGAVETVLSTDTVHVQVPFYVHLNYAGFERIIDLMGGTWVDVLEPMDYDDYNGHYHIHLKPGRRHMDGEEALVYVRYRGQSGDKGRILRQQAFIRATMRGLLSPYMLFRFPLILSEAWRSVDTNIRVSDMITLTLEMRALKAHRIGFKLLPGTTSGPYWAMDRAAARFVIQQFLGMISHDSPIHSPKDKVTISVWNASPEPGMARRVALALRLAGFDVVQWGNFESRQRMTRVVDRSGDLDAARKVAQFLGTDDFHSEVNPGLQVDVEVVVGEDYRGPGLNSTDPWERR